MMCNSTQFPRSSAVLKPKSRMVKAYYTLAIALEIVMGEQEITFVVNCGGKRHEATEIMFKEPEGENALGSLRID